ncbi:MULTISPECIES: class I SAM-dependent methyltransferase [unclassified Afipia]|uniref:class I SAM-dependent methyltransferase n=1 Tax=unclassified Afipia TaxID=2642050 RepID=UPI0004128B98|nr:MULTISPECIES: class I SAM-dependent methyltransferase [unclassified Afipia]
MRYDQLLSLVALYKPRSIVEIGTNQGDRGVLLCREALRHNPVVAYTGYDVFDTKDAEFHKQVFNGKGAFAKERVAARFDEINSQYPGFQYRLLQGTTAETLHSHDVRAEFVFIDGDHRVQTIALDYNAVKHSKVVVFDDYYSEAPDCEKIDTNIYGCNSIIDKSKSATILPNADRFPATGDIRMAALVKRHVFFRGRPIWF